MKQTKLIQMLAATALLGLAGGGAMGAGLTEFEDVQALNANPSPTPAQSNIDNYINQDEQLNISPEDGVIKVLRTDQKLLINDYVTAVFPLRNVHRREIRNVMRRVTAIEGGRAEVFQDKATGESFIQVIAPPYMMPYLETAVRALDVDWLREYATGAVDLYLRPLHRDAADIDVIAQFYAGNEGFSVIDETNNSIHRYDEAYRVDEYVRAAKILDQPCNQVVLKVRVYEVASADDLKLGLDYLSWKNGPGRTLFMFAEEGYRAVQDAAGATSVFDPFVDARAGVPQGDMREVVDSKLTGGSYRAVNYLLTSNFIDFLQVRRKARLVNEQTLTLCSANSGAVSTLEQVVSMVASPDTPAAAEVGPRVLRRLNGGEVTDDFGGADLAGGRVFIDRNGDGLFTAGVDSVLVDNDWSATEDVPDTNRRLDYENVGAVGMDLELTPYVGLESMELFVDLDMAEVSGVAPNGLPIFGTRTVRTTVRLLDGQPFVIASTKQVNDNDSTAKAPGLGSIPGLGYLFGGQQSLARRNDVVITIEPRFMIASEHAMENAPRVQTLEMIIEEGQAQGAPSLEWGFDQWLMGS